MLWQRRVLKVVLAMSLAVLGTQMPLDPVYANDPATVVTPSAAQASTMLAQTRFLHDDPATGAAIDNAMATGLTVKIISQATAENLAQLVPVRSGRTPALRSVVQGEGLTTVVDVYDTSSTSVGLDVSTITTGAGSGQDVHSALITVDSALVNGQYVLTSAVNGVQQPTRMSTAAPVGCFINLGCELLSTAGSAATEAACVNGGGVPLFCGISGAAVGQAIRTNCGNGAVTGVACGLSYGPKALKYTDTHCGPSDPQWCYGVVLATMQVPTFRNPRYIAMYHTYWNPSTNAYAYVWMGYGTPDSCSPGSCSYGKTDTQITNYAVRRSATIVYYDAFANWDSDYSSDEVWEQTSIAKNPT